MPGAPHRPDTAREDEVGEGRPPAYVGVDRCPDGWFAVAFRAGEFAEAEVFGEIGALWGHYEDDAERILVDVPIGLPEGEGQRPPDEAARSVLGSRAATVVAPPVREATRKQTYRVAKRVTERVADRGLSKQAFADAAAIAAVDSLLDGVPEARPVVREAHPEVCFRAFAGEPLDHAKTRAAGYAERMRALAAFDADAPVVVQSAAEATGDHEVSVDDVVDAVVLALTARPGPGELRTLPPDPPTDARGLPMEMVYRAAAPLET